MICGIIVIVDVCGAVRSGVIHLVQSRVKFVWSDIEVDFEVTLKFVWSDFKVDHEVILKYYWNVVIKCVKSNVLQNKTWNGYIKIKGNG